METAVYLACGSGVVVSSFSHPIGSQSLVWYIEVATQFSNSFKFIKFTLPVGMLFMLAINQSALLGKIWSGF